MKKYSYDIKYDIDKDMWNWRGATKQVFMGFDWRDNSNYVPDIKIAEKIENLNKPEAEKILKPFLIKQ